MGYRFETIDLSRHAATCVAFRRDSYVCSFGTTERFDADCGPGGEAYLHRLAERMAELPAGYVHLWRDDEIIGQMEMRLRDEPPIGYVNLFYLRPDARGSGAGEHLQAYAVAVFAGLGMDRIQLSVSPENARAMAYYRKHGWRSLGPRPGHEEVLLMEREISPAAQVPSSMKGR